MTVQRRPDSERGAYPYFRCMYLYVIPYRHEAHTLQQVLLVDVAASKSSKTKPQYTNDDARWRSFFFSFLSFTNSICPKSPTTNNVYGPSTHRKERRGRSTPLSPRPPFLVYWSGLDTSMACTTFLAHSSYTSTSERHASAPSSPFFSLCHAKKGSRCECKDVCVGLPSPDAC